MNESPQDQTRSIGKSMIFATWILLLAGMTWAFDRWLSHENNPNQHLADITANNETILERNRQGHYLANGKINGYPVEFLLDTGATNVAIPEAIAQRIGLQPGGSQWVNTANGQIQVFSTRLDTVQLGSITLNNIAAGINPADDSELVLLGMAFLKHLDMEQRGNTLTLRKPARP